MATQQEVIKTFMATLDTTTLRGTAALDEAIKACSDFDGLEDFRNKIISDCAQAADSATFLRDYCGIIIGNADTGAITGSDAGNGSVKNAKTIVPESGELIDFTENEFTAADLTVKLGAGGGTSDVKDRDFNDLSAQEQYIWQSLYSYWLKSSLTLIGNSYGKNFSFNENSSATTKTMYIIFDNANDGVLASTWGGPSFAQKSVNDLEIHINLYFYGAAAGEDGIPDSNQNYLDRTLAHELTHAVMRANIDYFDYLPDWLKEGMAELTHGVDDKRTADLRTLAGNSTLLRRALIGMNASGVTNPAYSGGYIALRYLAKQAADSYVKTFNGSDDAEQFETFNDSVTINAGGGDDTLGNGFYSSAEYSLKGGTNVYLRGGDGNDSIKNFGDNVTIDAGSGDDKIYNDGANVLLIYTSGNDSITGFNATSTLSIGGAYSSIVSGDDLILTVGDDSITLSKAASLSTVNVIETVTLDDDSAAKVTLTSDVEGGDASARTAALWLVGNKLDNTLLGGTGKDSIYGKDGNDYLAGNAGNDYLYGQNGDDTLWGGEGNDTLKGGDGNDLFIYDAGNDVIADYASGDKISLGADVTAASLSGSNSVLKFSGGSLTVKDAAELTLIDSTGTELTTIISGFTLNDNFDAKVTLASGVEVGDASARTQAIWFVGNALANSMVGGSGKDSLYGKDGDDYLEGNAGNDYLYGQNGDDTLYGGEGNDTLKGGDGDDLFICDAGNDIIADYASGDKISLGAEVSSASFNGSDSVLKFGGGSLTVKDAKELTLIDAGGTELTTIISGFTLDDDAASKVTLGSGVEDGDASARTTAIWLVGNALANTLLGGSGKDSLYGKDGDDYLAGNDGNDYLYGQNGNDTLWGGAGNDTLKGGDGDDLFIYDAGNDIIADFADDDLLQIAGEWTAAVTAAKTIAFTVGDGSLTLKNFTASTFNVNGDDYTISGNKLVIK